MTITFDVDADLRPFAPDIDAAKAQLMITDALAMAQAFAPCIFADGFTNEAAAKAIIRGAILRWNDSGSGALSQLSKTAGPWTETQSTDNRQTRKSAFWPSEITDLQSLCESPDTDRRLAFTIDTTPDETPPDYWDGTGIWNWVG